MNSLSVDRSLLTRQEQIIELNSTVKCVLKPSQIHGIGVFALRNISKGERLYCQPNLQTKGKFYNLSYAELNKLFPEVKELILQRWASIINGSLFQNPNDDAWLILFMNHSDIPNYDQYTDCAIRDIIKGEEILENYRKMLNHEAVFPWLKEKT